MITKFTVQGFKSLADFEIELGQVNVFIGANGSGKTNILEALGVLSAAARGIVDDEALQRRGVRLSAPGRYVTRLQSADAPADVALSAEWGEDSGRSGYSVRLCPPDATQNQAGNLWLYKGEGVCKGEEVWDSPPAKRDEAAATQGRLTDPLAGWVFGRLGQDWMPPEIEQLLLRLPAYAVYAPTTPVLRGTTSETQPRDAVGLSGGGLETGVIGLLSGRTGGAAVDGGALQRRALAEAESLLDWVDRVGVDQRKPSLLSPAVSSGAFVLYLEDRYVAEEWRRFAAYEASEGALYAMFAAVMAAHPTSPWIFGIDDFDHALHPRLARALIARFCEWIVDGPYGRQVLLTSHNPLLLDGLNLQDDRVRLFAVDRTSRGRTVARRIEVDERLLERAEDGWTLSRLWATGELGGVPDVW